MTTKKFNTWFKKRGLTPLNYQRDILLNKLNCIYTEKLPTVLAACPAAGKTIMSIFFIEKYLKENPNARVLVLTHGTTVLRSQYHDELNKLKVEFSFSHIVSKKDIQDCKSKVWIALPQTIRNNKIPQFDLVIVDEAHQFYFAKMVQSIIRRSKAKHQLLLTGTPSDFIAKKYPIIPIAVNDLMEYNMIEDLHVEVTSSAYNFGYKDYNESQELKSTIKIKSSDTNKTLTELLKQLKDRIKGKCMFACQSIEQAKQVHKFLLNHKINAVISTSDLDKESNEIQNFKTDKTITVLIVVYRGILGFNLPELQTVIDMTVSQNINRIFQLLARVIRKHPKGKKKQYIKVAPFHLKEYIKYVMTAVLCLTDKNYFTKYNGIGFMDLEIPVKKEKKNIVQKENQNKKTNEDKNFRVVDFIGLPAISFFKKLANEKSNCDFVKLKTVKAKLLHQNQRWDINSLKADASNYSSRKEWQMNSTGYGTARKLGVLDECCKHMFSRIWNLKSLREDALRFNSRREWQDNSSGYAAALRMGVTDECCKHMQRKKKIWNLKSLLEDALRYETRTEWENNSSGYSAALRMGVSDECCKHMQRKRKSWDLKKLKSDALKYSSRTAWNDNSSGYQAAIRLGVIDECCKHMEK